MITTTPKPLSTTVHLRPVTATIAVLTYNQPELVRGMIDQLGSCLMVIDNASNPPIPNADVIIPENRYFAGGWNYAMKAIDSEWVAMLNDDITGISLPMIYDLIDTAERSGYAAISPAFNSPHAHMQPQGTGLRPVASIDWVATLIRKNAWDDVGGFNEAMFKGWGAELDLAYRLKKEGYRMAVDDKHIIHHFGGVAAWESGTGNIQNNVEKMNASFQALYNVPDWMTFVQKYLI